MSSDKNEKPLDYVSRMAVEKSRKVKADYMDFVITADTIVVTTETAFFNADFVTK